MKRFLFILFLPALLFGAQYKVINLGAGKIGSPIFGEFYYHLNDKGEVLAIINEKPFLYTQQKGFQKITGIPDTYDLSIICFKNDGSFAGLTQSKDGSYPDSPFVYYPDKGYIDLREIAKKNGKTLVTSYEGKLYINQDGLVVCQAEFSDSSYDRIFTYSKDGKFTLLPRITKDDNLIYVNNSGLILIKNSMCFLMDANTHKITFLKDLGLVDILKKAAPEYYLIKMNDQGAILGTVDQHRINKEDFRFPFVHFPNRETIILGYKEHKYVNKEYPGSTFDINNNNQVAGSGTQFDNNKIKPYQSYIWSKESGFHDLGTEWQDKNANVQAISINDKGQIIGSVKWKEQRELVTKAFLWDKENGMRDLFHLVPPDQRDWTIRENGIVKINNRGEVLLGTKEGYVLLLVPN